MEHESDMLCFSAHGQLSIKTGSFPIHQQRMQGVVVGFKGSRIYALHYIAMNAVDVPRAPRSTATSRSGLRRGCRSRASA